MNTKDKTSVANCSDTGWSGSELGKHQRPVSRYKMSELPK